MPTDPARARRWRIRHYVPRGLLLQWHITERCNLRCVHCYQETYSGEELEYNGLLAILRQFEDLLDLWNRESMTAPVTGHITVTGGEPFVRSDSLDLLEVLSEKRENFSFAILTNGSFIDAATASRLRELGPSFVQLSIEGTKDTHDGIRGHGSFDTTVSAIKHLVSERIHTFISFTAHRMNFREFPEVARLGRRLKVSRVWADRLIPCGSGSEIRELMLTPDETREFIETMARARNEARGFWRGQTEISMHRALQFLVAGGEPYRCTAGDTLMAVQPNGDLYPCRRMPERVGNLIETPLQELYYSSDLFRSLRGRSRVSDGCEGCFYSKLCCGGLRCLSYAVTGDPFRADPGCWYAENGVSPSRLAASGGQVHQGGLTCEPLASQEGAEDE